MLERWVAELAAKTGRSLDEWLRHIQESGPKTEKECRTWLSEKYQLGTNSAGWLAEKAFGDAADLANDTPAGYLARPVGMSSRCTGDPRRCSSRFTTSWCGSPAGGKRRSRLPMQDDGAALPEACVCADQARQQKRIDLGLALGDEPFTLRLVDTGGRAKKDRDHTPGYADVARGNPDLQVSVAQRGISAMRD